MGNEKNCKNKNLYALCKSIVSLIRQKKGKATEKTVLEGLCEYLNFVSEELSKAIEDGRTDKIVGSSEYLKDHMSETKDVEIQYFLKFLRKYFNKSEFDELADLLVQVNTCCGTFKRDLDLFAEDKREYDGIRTSNMKSSTGKQAFNIVRCTMQIE